MWEKTLLLLLLIVANGAPILVAWRLGPRWGWPLDAGLVLRDGHRLLGESATVRGLVAAVVATALLAWVLGLGIGLGALIGFLALAGDAFSSFIKRRLGLPPGAKATGLDQVPEALLPLLVVAGPLGLHLPWLDLILLVIAFMLFDMAVSGPLYRLHLRRQPH
ncbi:MAG: CDP-archaeol synthase [Gammaproteobacteria bacterium]|jgi:CDP-2,3-bis-(O-geranylgeranyl)-sn-glycerol synthase|nr:CDP-archaeol synthase [Gammaproteobacteria bacterium]